MTERERQMLVVMARFHELSLTDLALRLEMSLPHASRLANGLVDRRLMQRNRPIRGDDLRRVLFSLTAAGRGAVRGEAA